MRSVSRAGFLRTFHERPYTVGGSFLEVLSQLFFRPLYGQSLLPQLHPPFRVNDLRMRRTM
jgi:hypothetical protein